MTSSNCRHFGLINDVRQHMEQISDLSLNKSQCSQCASYKHLWCCLNCYHIGCSRNVKKHAIEHAKSQQHFISVRLSNVTDLWCYNCSDFVKYPKSYIESMQEMIERKCQELKETLAILQNKQMGNEKLLSNNNNNNGIKEELFVFNKEYIFQSYLQQIFNSNIVDKYLASFVMNGFNDIEILMEFARMDANESLSVFCNDCGMNKIHARLLLRKVSRLEKENKQFHELLEMIEMVEYYETVMVKAGIFTFTILFQRVDTCEQLFQLFMQLMPRKVESRMSADAQFLWGKLPNNNRKQQKVSNKAGLNEGEQNTFSL